MRDIVRILEPYKVYEFVKNKMIECIIMEDHQKESFLVKCMDIALLYKSSKDIRVLNLTMERLRILIEDVPPDAGTNSWKYIGRYKPFTYYKEQIEIIWSDFLYLK